MSFSGGRTNASHWAIKPSLVDVLLNTLQFQFAHCHHIDTPNGRGFYTCGEITLVYLILDINFGFWALKLLILQN
jgi:hypothetical protein